MIADFTAGCNKRSLENRCFITQHLRTCLLRIRIDRGTVLPLKVNYHSSSKPTSASSFTGNSLPAVFSKEPSHSEKSYYCVRKTRSTAGNPDPETYLMPRESGWRECEVSYTSQDTKLTVITLALSTSQTGIKYNSNKMIDQDLSCNGCLIPCICIYLRGYLLTSAGATGCAALLKICLLTLWEPHYRCSYISGLSHSRINAMRRTCTLRSQTLG